MPTTAFQASHAAPGPHLRLKVKHPSPPYLKSTREHPTIRQSVRLLLQFKAPPIQYVALTYLKLLSSHANFHQDDSSAIKYAFHNISFIINPVYKLTICIDCEITVPAKHIWGHAVLQHSFKAPQLHERNLILISLGYINMFVRPSGIIVPVIGLRLLKGMVCKVNKCQHLMAVERTMVEYFQTHYPGLLWCPNIAECDT